MPEIKLRRPKLYFIKFRELIAFIANPKDKISSNLSLKEKLKEIVAFYIIKLFISTFLILIIELLFKINNDAVQSFSQNHHPFIVLLLGAFLAPLVEEAMFRLSIIFKPIFLAVSIGLFTLTILSRIEDVGILKFNETTYYRYGLGIVVSILVFYFSKKYQLIIKDFWQKNFRWIYYFSAITFGFFHFSNFDLAPSSFLLIPILTLPHTIGGLFFGYIRIKHGFIYSLIFHSLNNLISLSLAFLI